MLEMLGVLAITGVLSVGGIAGYSKAMMKFKLNKQRQQISEIMNGIIQHRQLITEVKGQPDFSLLPALAALNIVPDKMLTDGDSRYFYDVFNIKQQIRARVNTSPTTGKQTPLVFWTFTFANVEDSLGNMHEYFRNRTKFCR